MLNYIKKVLERINYFIQQAKQVAHDFDPNHERSTIFFLNLNWVIQGYYTDKAQGSRTKEEHPLLLPTHPLTSHSLHLNKSITNPQPVLLVPGQNSINHLPFLASKKITFNPLEHGGFSDHLSLSRSYQHQCSQMTSCFSKLNFPKFAHFFYELLIRA